MRKITRITIALISALLLVAFSTCMKQKEDIKKEYHTIQETNVGGQESIRIRR